MVAKILVVLKYGDFVAKSLNFDPYKYVSLDIKVFKIWHGEENYF